MFYIATLKKLYESIKTNKEIDESDKKQALECVSKLINILALY